MERQVSHYRLQERLGTGGAGVVYRAIDQRLGRQVALKFISSDLADRDDIRERFMLEAKAASSLDHPNICTIYDIDETAEGQLFLVMAFYGGETLDHVLRRGSLEPKRAVDIAIQSARGLSAAHDELIIHRDIKPGNLMICDDDTVKILDFGLAKLGGPLRLTDPDSAIGTPAYMSPEQIRNERVDSSADIWSLGVVLFEMLTGELPFGGTRVESVIHSILNEEPRQMAVTGGEPPERLNEIVRRALQKSPRARYRRIGEMISDLLDVRGDLDSSAITLRRRAESRKRSVAVLPFVDMSQQKDQGYLCDGIAEEILGALSGIPDLFVASRTSAFQFRAADVDVREIGRRLDVDTVLEGSVRKVGSRVRVAAQLVNVEDGYRIWNERYDRDMDDILAIQDEIAKAIAEALEVTFSARDQPPGESSTTDAEAFELYLRGRQFFHQHRRKSFQVARQTFERAIEIDPSYARAWAGIALCSAFLRLYFGEGDEQVRTADEASLKALELQPDLAEARVARGLALSLSSEYERAEVELSRAIEIDPGSYDAHYIFGRIAFTQGKTVEARRHFEHACEIEPEAPDSWYLLGMAYRTLGDRKRARSASLECIEAAKKRIDHHPDDTRAWTMGAAVFAELGEPEKATQWVERALDVDPDEPIIQYNAACVYVTLGRIDEALRCIEASVGLGAFLKGWVENDPDLDPLRDHPRFKALIRQS